LLDECSDPLRASAQSDAPAFPVSVCDTGPCLPRFNHAETVAFDRDGRLDVIASIGIHGVWVLRDNGMHERLHVFLGK